MKWQLSVILPLIISTTAIRVPVDKTDESNSNQSENNTSQSENSHRPIYYESEEEENVDSYLIPPNPHKEEAVLPGSIVTPATYLLPPSIDKQNDYYYAPTESTGQSDWYPISQSVPQDQPVKLQPLRQQSAPIPIFMENDNHSWPFEIYQRPRAGRVYNIPIPSLNLEPPAKDAQNDYVINVPSKELELPAEEIDQRFAQPDGDYPDLKFRLNSDHPTIASHLTPPRLVVRKFKNPTKLYPKKYPGSFTPLPIPIGQYADDLSEEVPKAKPAKYFKPTTGFDGPVLIPIDEKRTYLFEQAEEKRKLKGENEGLQEQDVPSADNLDDDVLPTEQDASETNFRYPGHNIYRPHPAPLRQRPVPSPAPAPAPAQVQHQGPPATDDRTEFRMHGMKGPHSYQFGYDTGKGKNRQFRFEERDNEGLVKGHYGYMDKNGKMRVVNYRAHPEHGFQAEPQVETEPEPKADVQEDAKEP